MIRRDGRNESGQPTWLLIAQSEHARLAHQLAACWRRRSGFSAAAYRQWLATVRAHDDGWDEWESVPHLDSVPGRPIQFTEMPGTTALPIWTRSIAACEDLGPLAAFTVSGHFSALLEQHRAR